MDFAIIRLIFAALVPVIFAIIFTLLTKRDNSFAKMPKSARQIIIGIVFGGIAILGTEFGIPVQGVQLNVRDAAPMVAGLVFGGPAGIIAGIIGGVERWLSVYWGMGTFTRFACSFSTVMAGFLAAAIRRFMTYNKKPDVGLALGSGVVMEVFHLSMIFFTNIKDETQAIEVVRVCFWPMVIANGLSVMTAVIAAKAVEGELKGIIRARREKEQRRIFKILRKWIVLAIGGAFLVAMWFSLSMQSNLAIKETSDRINVVISEVSEDVSDASDRHLLELGRLVTREIEIYEYDLDEMAKRYNLTDISIVDKNGIIIDSNNQSYIGYDMAAGEQSAEFLCLLNGEQEYVQAYGPIAMDSNIYRKYAGVAMQEGFIQVSYDAEAFQKDVDRQLENVVENRRIGENGGIIIIDANLATISKSESLSSLSFKNSKNVNVKPDGEIRSYDINGMSYYVSVRTVEGYYIVALYPVHDALQQRDISLYVVFFNMVLIFAFLYVLLFFLVRRVIVSKIEKVARSLDKISAGNLDTVVDVRGSEEFVSLSGNINQTVDTLKRYIAEAAARIDAELEFAKTIQESSLPKDFPETDEFSIYATMDTAKEVGGDFYDYYISDDGKLAHRLLYRQAVEQDRQLVAIGRHQAHNRLLQGKDLDSQHRQDVMPASLIARGRMTKLIAHPCMHSTLTQ